MNETTKSEAQAVAKVIVGTSDHGPFNFKVTTYGCDQLPEGESRLYTAPPSSKALVAAALRMAAGTCDRPIQGDEPAGFAWTRRHIKSAILALTPAEVSNGLEEFGMKIATRIRNGMPASCRPEDGQLRTFVKQVMEGEKSE